MIKSERECGYNLDWNDKDDECMIAGIGTNESINFIRCIDNPNCYYRQLQKAKQECKEHKANAESYCNSYQESCRVNDKLTDKYIDYSTRLSKIKTYARKYFDYENYNDVVALADGKEIED